MKTGRIQAVRQIIALALVLVSGGAVQAEPEPKVTSPPFTTPSGTTSEVSDPEIAYPIVFNSTAELEELGLSLDWPPSEIDTELKAPRFPNGCYLYRGQDRDHVVSVSDDFLAVYRAIGFSRESLCMALVSEARFDPETGERLPTFVLRDDDVLDRHLDELNPDAMTPEVLENYVPSQFATKGAFKAAIQMLKDRKFSGFDEDQLSVLVPATHHTYELPLRVPPCFKNGTPFLDCNWRYGLKSGRKLSSKAPRKYREAGQRVDQQIKAYIASGTGQRPYEHGDPYGQDTPAVKSYLPIDRLVRGREPGVTATWPHVLTLDIPDDDVEWAEPVAWYAASSAFPRGYGYALYAWSGYAETGGPAVSAGGLKMAFDGTRTSSLVKLARLKKILK
jgi:hypothetical protein